MKLTSYLGTRIGHIFFRILEFLCLLLNLYYVHFIHNQLERKHTFDKGLVEEKQSVLM